MNPTESLRVDRVAGRRPAVLLVLILGLVVVRPASAQQVASSSAPVALTLDEAIRLAESQNEQVTIAEAGVERARADELRARSQMLPQLGGAASYDRTLASEFATSFRSPTLPAGCSPFTANPAAPVGERVSAIEQAIDCGTVATNLFSSLGDLPFGRENIYRVGLSFSQALYAGGRIRAQRALAATGRQIANVGLSAARAQLVLDVTRAFYDAALSDRLVAIAEASLKQAEDTAALVELGHKAGRQPEFELLRARVARDNQRPLVIRARSQRTLAYLRLQQLLNVPASAAIRVAANLDDAALPPPDRFAGAVAEAQVQAGADDVDRRAPVRQALRGVDARQASLRAARAERWPSISFSSSYGRVAYPSALPTFGDFLTNWTVGVSASVPILTGGRIRGNEVAAHADLVEARARFNQARKLAQLDSRSAYETLQAATATWQASAGTVEQAQRAYEIAELRYREGVSTQLELSDARLLMQQAQANRAQAARDLQVARAHVALLPDLPLSASPLPSLSTAQPGGAEATTLPSGTGGAGGSTGAGSFPGNTTPGLAPGNPGGTSRVGGMFE